jgi:hypothetical protein
LIPLTAMLTMIMTTPTAAVVRTDRRTIWA